MNVLFSFDLFTVIRIVQILTESTLETVIFPVKDFTITLGLNTGSRNQIEGTLGCSTSASSISVDALRF